MLAIGLDGELAAFPRRSRPPGRRRGRSCSTDHAPSLSRRSTCRSMRAGGISRSTASTAGREHRRTHEMARSRRAGARGVRPRHRQRAARCRRGRRLALPRCRERARRSAAPRDLRSQASHVRERRVLGRCARDPLRVDADRLAELAASRARPAASRSAPTIRWSASKAAPICCAGSAGRVAANPEIFGTQRHATSRRPVRSSRGARARQRRLAAPRHPSRGARCISGRSGRRG